MSVRFPSLRMAVIAVVLGAVGGLPAAEPEPPVAPSPDAAPVQPATFLAPVASRSAGLPLTADAATEPSLAAASGGSRAAPRQPLPDWRLLAAIGGAFTVLAVVRTRAGRGRARLPSDVFEVLGEAPLGNGQAARIVRFGPKTLLVGVSSAGARTLAEIGDPQATECIVAACRGAHAAGRGLQRPKAAASQRAAAPPPRAGEAA
jgi:hypothetical protein